MKYKELENLGIAVKTDSYYDGYFYEYDGQMLDIDPSLKESQVSQISLQELLRLIFNAGKKRQSFEFKQMLDGKI